MSKCFPFFLCPAFPVNACYAAKSFLLEWAVCQPPANLGLLQKPVWLVAKWAFAKTWIQEHYNRFTLVQQGIILASVRYISA